jgi:carboxyl-terminal processing protease
MRVRRSALYCLMLLWASSCGGSPYAPPAPTSTNGQLYLTRLMDIMQANSANRLRIDWTSFRAQVAAAAGSAATIAETYPAIGVALGLLDDHHSFYRRADGINGISNPRFPAGCSVPAIATPSVPDDIGYVRIPATSAQGNEQVVFAEAIQQQIRDRDRDNLAGWIVDLRGNGGGNMWPMLAGIGPVLGDGVVGYFAYPTNERTTWAFDGRSSVSNGFVAVTTSGVTLKRAAPRVAVLTNRAVASSGEALVVAFRGRPETRSFGSPTCGVPTANRAFNLTDGAQLYLTTSVDADRALVSYDSAIDPDEAIADADATVQRAIQWLRSGG